jgi:hypothetical protein
MSMFFNASSSMRCGAIMRWSENCVRKMNFPKFLHATFGCTGFLEKEIRKDGIPMLDTGDNPDAPAPREMIDLEVSHCAVCSICHTEKSSTGDF